MKKEQLCDKKCIACSGATAPMSAEEGKVLLAELGGGWKIIDGKKLEKSYKFSNFKEALAFVNKVGALAEEEGHHPDFELGWGRVKIVLWTHKIGGLSESDFILAAKCDKIP
jgi:4a-hydroxytetrahydrobiopterin dehydratase